MHSYRIEINKNQYNAVLMQIFDKVNVQLHRVTENHRSDPKKNIGLYQWNFLSYSKVHRNVCCTSLNFMFESLKLFMVFRLENIGLQEKHLDQLIARHDYVKTSSCNLSSQKLPLYSHLRLGDDTVIKGHCAVLPTGCGCERVGLQMCCIKLPCCDDIQQEKETPNRLTYSESPSVHSSPLASQPNTPPPMQPSTADPSMSECTKGHGRKQAQHICKSALIFLLQVFVLLRSVPCSAARQLTFS